MCGTLVNFQLLPAYSVAAAPQPTTAVGGHPFPYLDRIFTAQPKYSVPLLSWYGVGGGG